MLRVATLNTRSLCQPGATQLLERTLCEHRLDVVALQQTGLRTETTTTEYTFTPGTQNQTRCLDAAFAIRTALIRHFQTVALPPRCAGLYYAPTDLLIISVYAPAATIFNSDEDTATFWTTLEDMLLALTPQYSSLLLLGDMNAHLNPDTLALEGHPVHPGHRGCTPSPAGHPLAAILCRLHLHVQNFRGQPPHHPLPTYKGTAAFPASTVDYCCTSHSLSPSVQSCYCRPTPKHTDHNILIIILTQPTPRRHLHRTKKPREPPQSEADHILHRLHLTTKHPSTLPELRITWTDDHLLLMDRQADLKHSNYYFTSPRRFNPPAASIAHLVRASAKEITEKAFAAFAQKLQTLYDQHNFADFHQAIKHRTGRKRTTAHTTPEQKARLTAHYRNLLCGPQTPSPPLAELFRVLPPRPIPYVAPPTDLPTLTIYTDGSLQRGLKIGAAVYAETTPPTFHLIPLSLHHYRPLTINFAEAHAVLTALHLFPRINLHIFSDSKVTCDTFRNRSSLQQSNFADSPHSDMWRHITILALHRNVQVEYVESHEGTRGNEIADKLAKTAARLNLPTAILTIPPPADDSIWFNDEEECIASLMTASHTATHRPPIPPLPPGTTVPCTAAPDTPPTKDEIVLALRDAENTTPGDDEIRNSDLKNPANLDTLLDLFTLVWHSTTLCSSWHRSTLIPIKKSAGPPDPSNTRGISLIQCSLKLLDRILLNRHPAPAILGNQLGFQRARSCPQAIHAVRQLISTCLNARRPIAIIFYDIAKAFDTVPRTAILEAMQLHGHSPTDIALTQQMMTDQIRLRFPDNTYSEPLTPTVGTKQGSIRSPRLYTLVLDLPLRNARLRGVDLDSPQGPICFTLLAYADDLATACEPQDIEHNITELDLQLSKINQKINRDKTKILLIAPDCPRDAKDTTQGYEGRLEKLTISRRTHPNAIPSALRDGLLLTPRGNRDIACCFADCPYTATRNQRTSPQDLLISHVRRTHALPRIKRFLTFGIPEPTNHTDPRYTRPPPREPERIAGIEVTSHFKYLGSTLADDGSLTAELDRRIANANRAFFSIPRELWTSTQLSIHARRQLYRSRVEPCLTYGAETWNPDTNEIRRLNGTYMRHLRIICRKQPLRTELNGELHWDTPAQHLVLSQLNLPTIACLLRQNRLRLAGQIIRQTDNVALLWSQGTTPIPLLRGPSPKTWDDLIREDMASLELLPEDAHDITTWKEKTKARLIR